MKYMTKFVVNWYKMSVYVKKRLRYKYQLNCNINWIYVGVDYKMCWDNL